ncbi:MAG: hypothetical protein ACFFAS_11830 [Promethearchaeota archaeon]
MNEDKEEWDESKPDPTKEAFFSDLMEMEEEIASEGYEIVSHAINLINSQYYDDAIEMLRQAIGIYNQIDRKEEINAIEQKISEVIVLKEQSFIKTEIDAPSAEGNKSNGKIADDEHLENIEVTHSNLSDVAQKLVIEGNQLEEIEEFDDAIGKYDEALNIYNELSDNDQITKIELLIGNCYYKKANFLKRGEKDEILSADQDEIKKGIITEESEGFQELPDSDYEIMKKKERYLSDLAYKLMVRASQCLKNQDYDKAIEFYEEASILFMQLNWEYELNKIKENILEIQRKKTSLDTKESEQFLEDIGEKQMLSEDIIEIPIESEESVLKLEETKIKDELEAENKKRDDKIFEEQISKMVEDIEKKVRDYESELRKDVKYTLDSMESPYSEAIDVYTNIKEMLVERGWTNLIVPYVNQINIYHQKLNKDENLRIIEEKKITRQKQIEEMHKIEEQKPDLDVFEKINKEVKQEKERSIEEQINEILDKAQRMDREYELELKKGNFIDCPYPEIIDMYKSIQTMLIEKGLTQAASVYNNSIRLYKDKIQKDNKLREVEAQKAMIDEDKEDIEKLEKIEEHLAEFEKKMDVIQKIKQEETEKQSFNEIINEMIRKIEIMDREYTLALKKKNFIECPYDKIINIYREIQSLLRERGLEKEALAYHNSIRLYKNKIEKDKKLREIEARKAQKDKEFAEVYKVKPIKKQQEVITPAPNKAREKDKAEQAMKLIEDAENEIRVYETYLKKDILSVESPFDRIISYYRDARRLFLDINWTEEANRLIKTIKFYKDKKIRDDRLRTVEMQKIKAEKAKQEHLGKRRVELERLEIERQKQGELEKKEKEKEEIRNKREKALLLMDQGKREYMQDNYQEAIKLYENSETILNEIGWKEGVNMVQESITAIKDKLEQIEKNNRIMEEMQARKEKVRNQLEDQIEKVQEQSELEEESKRNALLRKQRIKEQEKKLSEEAYALLEQGTVLLNKRKFAKATEKYTQARDLFKKIGWNLEVSRINSDLLLKVMREQNKYERLMVLRQKKIKTKEERTELLSRAKTLQKERVKKRTNYDMNISENLEASQMMMDELKYNESALVLKKAINLLKQAGKREEIPQLKKQISKLKDKCLVPIITIENISENDSPQTFKAAYTALDRANKSLYENRTMKAISELIEAKYNLETMSLSKKEVYLNNINTLLKKHKANMGQEPDALRPKKKVDSSQFDAEELKKRIEARRAEREKRIKELLKSKK